MNRHPSGFTVSRSLWLYTMVEKRSAEVNENYTEGIKINYNGLFNFYFYFGILI